MKRHSAPIIAAVLLLSVCGLRLLADLPKVARPVFPLRVKEASFQNRSKNLVKAFSFRSGTLAQRSGFVFPKKYTMYGYPLPDKQPKIERQLEVTWTVDGQEERTVTLDLEKLGVAEQIAGTQKVNIFVDAMGEIVVEGRSPTRND